MKNTKEKNVILFFWEYYKHFNIPWWLYILSMAMGIVSAELTLQVSAAMIRINKGELYNSVILGYVFICVFNSLIVFGQNLLQEYGDQTIIYRARIVLWNKILKLPVKKVEEEQPSTFVSAMTVETEEAATIIRTIFFSGSSVYGLMRACVTLYHYQATLTLYMLILLPALILVFYLVGKIQYIVMSRRYSAMNQMTTFFSEHVSAGKYVKAQVMEEKEIENGFAAINIRYRADVQYAFLDALQIFVNAIYTNITMIVVAVCGAGFIRKRLMERTGINTFSTYMTNVNQMITEMIMHYQGLMGMKGALSHVNQVLNLPEEKADEGIEWVDNENKDIVFKNVSFSYDGRNNVLQNISFCIPAGKTTAIVGANGCGKSTVMKLMQGLYPIDSGEIYVAGNKVSGVKKSELREHFGYVLRDNPIFAGTINENLLYGLKREITKEELEKVKKGTCLDEFVLNLPDGYQTKVFDGENLLSDGQRQRIAIARSIILNPDYLLLDEAGENLDFENHKKIYDTISKNRIGKTMVFITHNMDEIKVADQIIVLNKGSVEACGNHEQLLAKSATYREYVNKINEEMEELS